MCVFRAVVRASASSIPRVPADRTISSMTQGRSQLTGISFPAPCAHPFSRRKERNRADPQNRFTSPALFWLKDSGCTPWFSLRSHTPRTSLSETRRLRTPQKAAAYAEETVLLKKNRGFQCVGVGGSWLRVLLFLHQPSRQRCRRTWGKHDEEEQRTVRLLCSSWLWVESCKTRSGICRGEEWISLVVTLLNARKIIAMTPSWIESVIRANIYV